MLRDLHRGETKRNLYTQEHLSQESGVLRSWSRLRDDIGKSLDGGLINVLQEASTRLISPKTVRHPATLSGNVLL